MFPHSGQVIEGRGSTGWLVMVPMVPCMDFSAALTAMREHDQRMTREGWHGEGMWVAIQWPDDHSTMRRPYFYLSPVGGGPVPWVASHSDLLATDWQLVP